MGATSLSWRSLTPQDGASLTDGCWFAPGMRATASSRSHQQRLRLEVAAWQTPGNAKASSVDCQFNAQEARIGLERPYPSYVD